MARRVAVIPGSSRKLSQLTGEFDVERGRPTRSRTVTRFLLAGTDLGQSVLHNGRLYFLFGDTNPVDLSSPWRPFAGDSIASTTETDPTAGLRLDFVTAPDGGYRAITVPGVSLGSFEVPTGAFSAGGRLYAFLATDSSVQTMSRSVLASSADGGVSWTAHYEVSRDKFINIAPIVVDAAAVPGLPRPSGLGLLLWASGPYRLSDPYLAFVTLAEVGRRDAWRFYAGPGATGLPRWSEREADAAPLFHHVGIGELSVAWVEPLDAWLMLYNADNPNGIIYTVADEPWGPWSQPGLLFDPVADGGYCHFIHRSWDAGVCDDVHDPGREFEWGDPYGPYLIPSFTRGSAGMARVFYVMSTWNPYNTVLMSATLRDQDVPPRERVAGVPALIQSRFGVTGTFEVLTPWPDAGLAHYRRDNDVAGFPWYGPVSVPATDVPFEAATLIQSNFGWPGSLEAVARIDDRLVFYWWDGVAWYGPSPVIADGVEAAGHRGNPALIQGRFGGRGNFELLAPLADGGLAHYWRDNDDPALPWHGPAIIAPESGPYDAVTLIQSNFGWPGNFEVVARTGDRLALFWRDNDAWYGPLSLVADGVEVSGVAGNPSLIQGRFGTMGNFELVVPRLGGGCVHYWRDNDAPGFPWHGPNVVDEDSPIAAVSLIQSGFGWPGNLELLARIDDRLAIAWRDSGPDYRRSGFAEITAG